MTPTRRAALLAAVLAAASGTLTGAAVAVPRQVATVHLDVAVTEELGPLRHDLVGFGWHRRSDGLAPLRAVEDLAPHHLRIDASLQDVSTAADAPLDLEPLLDMVAEAREIGAEPLIILSYMPAWLGAPTAAGRDPTRVRPADLDAWQDLVHDVVLALATAPAPALVFEAWNEPDVPLFWQDLPSAWIETVDRTARAIVEVEQETGLDLAFLGPATAFPDPVYLEPFLAHFRDPSLPLDGVTWHYYGNYPFFGPDGAEFAITEPIQPVVGQENPLASPAVYGSQIELVRALVEASLAGSGRAMPELILDEWNLSAAGYDDRHDTHEGAAFVAGTLSEMQSARLDASAFFRATETVGVVGEHGLVKLDGSVKPAWWTFWLWQRLPGTEVAVDGDGLASGVWATAAVDEHRLAVLVSSFQGSNASPHHVELELTGLASSPAEATVRRIDAGHPTAAEATPIAVDGTTIRLDLPAQAVALVELSFSAPAPAGPAGGSDPELVTGGEEPAELPRTGDGVPGWILLAASAAGLAGVAVGRPLLRGAGRS